MKCIQDSNIGGIRNRNKKIVKALSGVITASIILQGVPASAAISSETITAIQNADDINITDEDSEIVNIPDENLKKALNKELNQDEDSKITKAQMESITQLYLFDLQIESLEGLQYCINLDKLDIMKNNITDLSQIKELDKLTYLNIGQNYITDISSLSNLINLEVFYSFGNDITDLTPLKRLVNLNELGFDGENITDISALSGLISLSGLSMVNTSVSDVSPLKNLLSLDFLLITDSPVSDLSSLKELSSLKTLVIASGQVMDISPLDGMDISYMISRQVAQLDKIKAVDGVIEIENPLKDRVGNIIEPARISNDGVYDKETNKIKWTNVSKLEKVEFSFSSYEEINGEVCEFTGTVIQNIDNSQEETPSEIPEDKPIETPDDKPEDKPNETPSDNKQSSENSNKQENNAIKNEETNKDKGQNLNTISNNKSSTTTKTSDVSSLPTIASLILGLGGMIICRKKK
ncbi:MAG: leucine-rich repeat domain-containing protein [Clostridium sp.]